MENNTVLEHIRTSLEHFIEITNHDYIKGDLTIYFKFKTNAWTSNQIAVQADMFSNNSTQTLPKYTYLSSPTHYKFNNLGVSNNADLYSELFSFVVKPYSKLVHFKNVGDINE